MACKTSCKLCPHLVISQAVTFADDTLTIKHPCRCIPERREVLYRGCSELAGHDHHQRTCGHHHRCRHDRIPSDRLQLRSGDRREHPHPHPLTLPVWGATSATGTGTFKYLGCFCRSHAGAPASIS